VCIFLLPSVGEGVPKGRMRGGFPLKQALVIPSPAGDCASKKCRVGTAGRGPGRGWARFTSPPGGGRSQSSRHLGRQSRWCEAGSGGRFFSFNLCPLCGRHSAPLFSPRSRPMNLTVSRTRPGSSDLANAAVTAREPTATEKPSTFLRSSKTAPATGIRDPAISGRRKTTKLWFNRWMGRMGTAPLLVDKDECSPGRPTSANRSPVK
jgi:hypothetical protein